MSHNTTMDYGGGGAGGQRAGAAGGQGAGRTRSVTLTLDDNDGDPKRDKPSNSDYSGLLSVLYAIILVLVGLLFPVTEALHGTWLTSEYTVAFLVYIYVVATLFLLYFQLYLIPLSKHHSDQHKQKRFKFPHIRRSASGIHINEVEQTTDNHTSTYQTNHVTTTSPHMTTTPVGEAGGGVGGGTGGTVGGAGPKYRKKSQKSTRDNSGLSTMIRYSSSVSNINTREARTDYERQNGGQTISNGGISRNWSNMSDDSGVHDHYSHNVAAPFTGGGLGGSVGGGLGGSVGGEEGEELEDVWIDAGQLGNLFSHEGSSFYLRIGSLLFGIGHIIYISLEIVNSSQPKDGCPDIKFWWTYIIRLIFIVLQTFFIFKNPHFHFTKHEAAARFGLMHLIATNMCVWIRTLVNEIMEEYHHLTHMPSNPPDEYNSSATPAPHHTLWRRYREEGGRVGEEEGLISQYLYQVAELKPYADDGHESGVNCLGILQDAAPYLFPFVLEYSLIAMGTISIMYFSIDEEKKNGVVQGLSNIMRIHALEDDKENNSRDGEGEHGAGGGEGHHHLPDLLVKSNRGMFAGILVLCGSIISIVLFMFNVSAHPEISELDYYCTDICMNGLLMLATIVAIVKLNVLNYVEKPSSVDDTLLLISMAGSLLYEMSMMAPAGECISSCSSSSTHASTGSSNGDVLTIAALALTSALLASLQTLLQVILVLSGMRRYPSKREHVKNMPGRGAITFLILGNVAAWIYRTALAKDLLLHTIPMNYYDDLAWLLLVNISLPLLLFYRFHSSICLADVWSSAYTPLHEKVPKGAVSPPPGGIPATTSGTDLSRAPSRVGGGTLGGGGFGSQLLRSVSYATLTRAPSADRMHTSHSDRDLKGGMDVRGRGGPFEDGSRLVGGMYDAGESTGSVGRQRSVGSMGREGEGDLVGGGGGGGGGLVMATFNPLLGDFVTTSDDVSGYALMHM